jgi:hypothetical protein
VVVVGGVDPDSYLVGGGHLSGCWAGEEPSGLRMPWVSIVVVDVVVGVGEGWSDLTAFVMQDEFGKGVVESIAIKLTYVFRNWMTLSGSPQFTNHRASYLTQRKPFGRAI